MRSTSHMRIESMDVIESNVAITAAKLWRVHLTPKVRLERRLAIKRPVALGAEAMSREDAVVLQNVIPLAFLIIVAAELDSNMTLRDRWVFAIRPTSMCNEMPRALLCSSRSIALLYVRPQKQPNAKLE